MALILHLAPVGQATAGPLEDAFEAYNANKYETAPRLFRSLAVQGNPAAQYKLGVMYNLGQGVAQDYVEALRWFRLAAGQRYAIAQANLGVMYANGDGVARD